MKAKEVKQSELCQSGNGDDGEAPRACGDPLESVTPLKLRYGQGQRVKLRNPRDSSTTGASALVSFEF